MSVVDKLTKIDQVAAISAGNLAEGLARVSTTAQQAGLSLDETAAMVTTITEVTQRDASTAGEALRTLISRYSNVKAGVFTDMSDSAEETSGNINDIEKVLGKLGIRIRTSGTEMRSIEDVLDELAEKWDTLDDVSRNAVASAFAGVRQRESFNILLSNWNRVKELTEESANAAGTADEKYSAYMDSMEAATKRLQNAWEGFTQSLGGTSTVMKFLTNKVAFLVENADKLKYLVTFIAAMSSAKIFDFFTNKGETGGFKGLIANIPFIGRGTKTNNILESIDKKVGDIRGEVKKDKSGVTKNGGLISRLMSGRKQYKADEAFVKKDVMQAAAMAASKEAYLSQAKKVNALRVMSEDIGGPLSDFDEMQEAQIMQQQYEEEKKILQEKRQQYKAQEAISKTNKEEVKLAKARIAAQKKLSLDTFKQTAAISGIATLATQLLTTKEVGTGIGGWAGKVITGNRGNQQTLEETAGDKALRTGLATAGSIAGAATAFIPVVGPAIAPIASAIGSVAGEGIGGLLSTWFRADELAMKQRVADAKENLSRLDAIKSTMETNSSVMTEELASSEDFEKLYKYTDDLYDKLFELQYEGNVDIISAINHFAETVGNKTQIKTISELVDKINNGNVDQRSMIKRQLELAESQVNLEELQKSQELERVKAAETLSTGFEFTFDARYYNATTRKQKSVLEKELQEVAGLSFSKLATDSDYTFKLKDLSPKETKDTLKKVLSIYNRALENGVISSEKYEKITQKINEYISSIKEAASTLSSLDKELIEARSNIGFLAADIHNLTTTELKDLTMDGVVGRVVEALEAQGVEVRNAAGYIKDEYQDAVEKLIKSDSKFNALQQADTKTLGQLTSAQERFSSMLKEQVELVKEYGKSWDKWYDAAKRGELSEEIAKIVYAANPERIEQFARAWNTTREGLEKLTKEFPDLTTAIGLMSPSEVREYYSVFTDLFEDLAADSALTAENFEKLINQYPQLLKYYKNGTLSTELLSKANEEQRVAYANAMLSAELSNTGIGEGFLAAIKSVSMGEANEEAARFVNLTKESAATILKEIGSVKSLNEVLDKANALRQKGDEDAALALEGLVKQYLNYEKVIEWTDPIYAMAQQGEIDRLTQEIENLNEQKDALSNVNDERQRELDLIKAKEALENARKEKKRVYRQGVGFVMESDEEAITTAQENLDKLNIEKQQEDIQYQIEQLESLKSILENLDEEKQKEANKKALQAYFGKGNPLDPDSALVEKLVNSYAENRISINTGTGKIKDAKGNVIGKIDGLGSSEDGTGVIGGKNEESEKAKEKLETSMLNFRQKYDKETGNKREWQTAVPKGTREYSTEVGEYNKFYKDLEDSITAAKNFGIAIPDAAEEYLKYGKQEDVSYKVVDLIVNEEYGNGNIKFGKNRAGQVKLDPIFGETEGRSTKDPIEYPRKNIVKTYNNGNWSDWESWADNEKTGSDLLRLPDFSIVGNSEGRDEFYFIYEGKLYPIRDLEGNEKNYNPGSNFATGTLSTSEGLSLINELGTEAVITPGGTLTALPSKTGIVPADITRNVWALGEVAPTLVAQLGSLTQKTLSGNAGNTTYEEGQYFDNFTMNVYPAKGDDFNKILEQARAQMRLTRHNN